MTIVRIVLIAIGLVSSNIVAASAQTANSNPPSSLSQVTGILKAVNVVPNVPGARCGSHHELTVLADGGKRLALQIYDPTISDGDLTIFKGKKIEIDLVGDTIIRNIRLAGTQRTVVAALTSLSTRARC